MFRAPRRAAWRRSALLLAVCAVAVPRTEAAAQDADPGTAVILSALEHARGTVAEGDLAVDPRPLCRFRLIGWSCPEGIETALREMGYSLSSREFSHVCLPGRSSCRLIGTDALVAFGLPRITGSAAELTLDVWWRSGDRAQPVGHRRSDLQLTRIGQGWRVVGSAARVVEPDDLPRSEEHPAAPPR